MKQSTLRGLGAGCLLAAVLFIFVGIPGEWYGVPQSTAYVFTPSPFEPLWIYRILRPLCLGVAFALVAGGVTALDSRDGTASDASSVVVYLLAILTAFACVIVALGGLSSDLSHQDWRIEVSILLAIWGGKVLFVLVLSGLAAIGYRYFEAGQQRFGGLLFLGAVHTAGLAFVSAEMDVGPLAPAVLFAVTVASIGVELWREPAHASTTSQ